MTRKRIKQTLRFPLSSPPSSKLMPPSCLCQYEPPEAIHPLKATVDWPQKGPQGRDWADHCQ